MNVHVAVFLITLSGLIFEIGLTRIYSATIWYHFAFIAVSVALLGWGLGGVVLHLLRDRIVPTLDRAAVLAMLYAFTILVCLWSIVQYPFRLERLALYFVAPLLPFLIAGMVLSMVFQMRRDTAGSLYFADLLGAALGALAVTFLLEAFGSETTLLLAAIFPFGAAALLSPKVRTVAAIGGIVLLVVAVSNERMGTFRVTPGTLKAM